VDTLRVEISENIATITIARETKLNALNATVFNELETVMSEVSRDETVRVIIITGAGQKSFVAGADISQFPSMSPADALAFSRRGQAVLSLIETSSKPVLAAINGFALGGGCELALACHLRFAVENAMFGQPEVKLGVIAGFGGTQRLPRLIGKGRALDLLLSGRMVNAEEALQMGLINRIYSANELMTQVRNYASILIEQGALAQAHTLHAVTEGIEGTLTLGMEVEAEAFRDVFETEDRVEGTTAFLKRRSPEFKNR